jgi:hypothetical protein
MTVAGLNVAPPNGVGSADWALIESEPTSPTMLKGRSGASRASLQATTAESVFELYSMPRPSADDAALMPPYLLEDGPSRTSLDVRGSSGPGFPKLGLWPESCTHQGKQGDRTKGPSHEHRSHCRDRSSCTAVWRRGLLLEETGLNAGTNGLVLGGCRVTFSGQVRVISAFALVT